MSEFEAYLNHLRFERRLSPRSIERYQHDLRLLAQLAQGAAHPPGHDSGPVALHELQSHQLRRLAAQLHNRGLHGRTIAHTLSAWRGWYRWLGQQGQISHNPVQGLRSPKVARPLPKALTVEQSLVLMRTPPASQSGQRARPKPHIDAALHARDQAMLELLYSSGLRINELIGLNLQAQSGQGWLDLQSQEVHVLGKGGKRRSVPVGGPALQALTHWLEHRQALKSPHVQADDALFLGLQGRRIAPTQIRAVLKARAQAAGLPTHVHPHMLRHSFATHVFQSSGDLRGTQELLGHAHISTTQVYTQLDLQHLAKVYDAAHPRAQKKPS